MFFAFLFDIKTLLKLLNIIDRNWSKKKKNLFKGQGHAQCEHYGYINPPSGGLGFWSDWLFCMSIGVRKKYLMDLHEMFARGGSRAKAQSVRFWGWSRLQFKSRIWITIQIQDPDYYQDYIQIARIFMQCLPEVCLGPRTDPLNLGMIQITIRI